MNAYGLKSIDVHTIGTDITIALKGEFIDTRFSLSGVESIRRASGIELSIVTYFDETKPVTLDRAPLKSTLSMTDLNPGVYYVRVDNNNNWVKWFRVSGQTAELFNIKQ